MLRASVVRAAQQLHELDLDVRLILVHPNEIAQHLLLTLFSDSLYVRFDGVLLTTIHLQTQFDVALAAHNVAGNLDQTSYIVLDECDRALEDEFALFVHAL
ncbi:MAG: hypothetical protein SGI73_20120, partial [Chloroflexota bacterium]|nr:hypothetical protein [Chloroflexota bacterium]